MTMTRRQALKHAAAFGAVLAWPSALLPREANGAASEATNETVARSATERRDLFPQGVASGDPYPDSVVLWTRRPPVGESRASVLAVEVAEDPAFARVVSRAVAHLAAEADWTCRVLAAGLTPSRVYWYRFVDEHGFASRTGRTLTAPAPDDRRPVSFAFVSCQNVTQGASNAYRRMIWEDERAAEADRLGFVLHLGDFVYEIVWYPEDRPQGMYDRRIRDVVRYPTGEKIEDFHVPTDVADYRAVYRGYLTDPDLQDARARWPFVCMWDNHEFSWRGWQSQQNFGSGVRPAQTRKVAAAQAWFEYQPARVERPGAAAAGDRFVAPAVRDVPIERFDEQGLGLEPGNLAAIGSLKLYRALRFGANVDLILTDNRSYRSEPLGDRPESGAFEAKGFSYFESQDVAEILDAGRAFDGGKPPSTIAWGGREVPNPRRAAPPQSMLGAAQKAWFLGRLRDSTARWRLWGNSVGMADWRADLQNLPPGAGPKWPAAGYGLMAGGDWSSYRTERAEILDFVRRERLAGFASLAGDRHAFSAARVSPSLPPRPFEPVGVEFIVGSISAPGLFEAATHKIPKNYPLRPLILYDPLGPQGPHDPPAAAHLEPAINFTLRHGVRASLELQRTHDRERALALHNPEVAPHLDFVDLGGHGYAVVRAGADDLEVEFVCVVRPLERSDRPDGGPLAYRVAHRVARWTPGAAPRLARTRVEGELPLSV